MSVLLTLYSHIWLTLYNGHFFSLEDPLSLLPDYLLNIFQISAKTTTTKQPFETLKRVRSPCYVDIGHSVLFPLDTCPNCGATFNFVFCFVLFFFVSYMIFYMFQCHSPNWNLPLSVFLLKFKSNSQSPHVCSSLLSILCIQQAFVVFV